MPTDDRGSCYWPVTAEYIDSPGGRLEAAVSECEEGAAEETLLNVCGSCQYLGGWMIWTFHDVITVIKVASREQRGP